MNQVIPQPTNFKTQHFVKGIKFLYLEMSKFVEIKALVKLIRSTISYQRMEQYFSILSVNLGL